MELARFIVLIAIETVLFGHFGYQAATIAVALLLQLEKKYSEERVGWPILEERMFIMSFVATIMFDAPWMFFEGNFYQIPCPQSIGPTVFVVVCSLLVHTAYSNIVPLTCAAQA